MAQKIGIETAYNVELDYNLSTVWDRIWANFIDSLLKYGYLLIVFLTIGEAILDFSWLYMLFIIPFLFYSLFFETINNGQTPGKSAMNIRVVSIDGKNLQFSQVVTRWFLRLFDLVVFGASVAFITVVSSRKAQRVGDVAAGTAVIALKSNTSVSRSSKVKLPKGFVGTDKVVLKLKNEEIELLKDAVRNRTEAGDKIRVAAAKKVVDFLGVPKEVPSKDYLKNIVYQYNYFHLVEQGEIVPLEVAKIELNTDSVNNDGKNIEGTYVPDIQDDNNHEEQNEEE